MRNTPLIVGIIIVILIGVGVYAVSNNNSTTATSTDTMNATDTMQTPGDDGDGDNDNTVGATTTPDTSNTGAGASVSTGTGTSKTATVAIKNFAFTPATLNVKTGTKVTWTNGDTAPHTVTSVTGSTLNSPQLSTGQSYSFTFTKAGTYNYYCTVHPNMKATVVVTD